MNYTPKPSKYDSSPEFTPNENPKNSVMTKFHKKYIYSCNEFYSWYSHRDNILKYYKNNPSKIAIFILCYNKIIEKFVNLANEYNKLAPWTFNEENIARI